MQGMATALMLAVLALAVTVEQAASAEESFVPSVLYVSFQLNDTQPYDSSNDSVIIDKSDDTPLVELRLPNLFPFFGEFIDRVFVSPNGYVQTSPVNLCRCCFCFPCGADYYGMIAGILQDLNTFGSDAAYVSVHQSQSNVTTIYYNKVYYFGYEHYQMDFGIRLFPDGGINVMYDNVTQYDKLFSGQKNCSWLTGLIAPNIAHSNKTFTVTSDQKDVQNNVWAAKNLGVYPYSRGDVISNSRLILCPVSTVWGITPAIIDNQTSIVNITTLSMSCVGEHHDRNHSIQIALSFTSNYSSGRHALQDFMECDPMDVVADIKPSPVTFTCNFSNFNMSLFADHEELLFYVVWRPAILADSATDYQFFGAPDEFLPLRVNFSNMVDPTSCAVTKPVGSCTPCEIVRSGYESASVLDCLNLDCTHDQSLSTLDTFHSTASFSTFSDVSYYQTLYMRPSCYNESCESTFAYDIDYMGECCLISDMDCMGKCDGTSVAGMNLRQGWMNCCSPGEAIDCLGYCNGPATHDCLGVCAGSAVFDCHDVCNGTAVIDACGVCGGRDAYFCPKVNLSVDTGPNPFNSAHHLLTVYDASNRLHVAVNYITVTNENDVMLNISFEIPVIPTLPPFFSLPQGVYHISPMSNVSFLILSNMTDLFDRYDSWAVNTFNIRYSREPSHHSSCTFSIDILPSMSNCSVFSKISRCKQFPGCEFCLGLSGGDGNDGELRVLSSLDTISAINGPISAIDYYYERNSLVTENAESEIEYLTRALYANIVPIYHDSITDEDILLNGYCSTGFSSCDIATISAQSDSSSPCRSPHIAMSVTQLISVFILVLIFSFK